MRDRAGETAIVMLMAERKRRQDGKRKEGESAEEEKKWKGGREGREGERQ